jgi:hypothetical protein
LTEAKVIKTSAKTVRKSSKLEGSFAMYEAELFSLDAPAWTAIIVEVYEGNQHLIKYCLPKTGQKPTFR